MKFLCLLSVLVLASCKFGGSVNVSSDLELKQVKERILLKDKVTLVKVPAGAYSAVIDFDKGLLQKRKLELTLSKDGKKVVEADFKIPKDIKIPDYNGSIAVSAAQSGQGYDFLGNVKTVETSSDLRQSTRSCTYHTRAVRCKEECTKNPDGSRSCNRVCKNILVEHRGHQFYEYRLVTKVQNVDIKLSLPEGGAEVAEFKGQETGTYENVISSGICR